MALSKSELTVTYQGHHVLKHHVCQTCLRFSGSEAMDCIVNLKKEPFTLRYQQIQTYRKSMILQAKLM